MTDARHRPVFFDAPKDRTNRRWPVYTMEDVAKHAHKDDCWFVIHDKVIDLTKHLATHEGWTGGGKVSTLIALLCAMGTDCTEDVLDSHDTHAMRQIELFQIGVLDKPNTGCQRMQFLTWEQIEAAGYDASKARRNALAAAGRVQMDEWRCVGDAPRPEEDRAAAESTVFAMERNANSAETQPQTAAALGCDMPS